MTRLRLKQFAILWLRRSIAVPLGIFMLASSTAPLLAATATSSVGATLLGSISSAANLNMQFGELTAGPIAGAVILTPNGARSATGGVNLAFTGTSSPATFTLTGTPNANYAITFPVFVTLTDGAGDTMQVDQFNSYPAATGQLSATGQQVLAVGGRLIVPANQPMGGYSGILTISIVYY